MRTALGPWLTSSATPAAVELPPRKGPIPRVPVAVPQQQKQQQLVPIRPPHRQQEQAPATALTAQPAPTHDARMKELESVLFPLQRHAVEHAVVGEISMGQRDEPNAAIDADSSLPRLSNLDWLAKDLGQTGRYGRVRVVAVP